MKIKTAALIILIFLQLTATIPASAAEVRGKVISVRVDKSGLGMAVFDTPIASTLACVQPDYKNALAFDTRTPGGKAFLALMLSAKAFNSPVHAYTTDDCSAYGYYVEDVLYANVE